MSPQPARATSLLGVESGSSQSVETGAGAVLLVCLDPTDPPPRIDGATALIVVASQQVAVRGAPVLARTPLGALGAACRGTSPRPREAVVHSLEALRLGPVITAAAAGVRRFHFTHSVGASLTTPAATAVALGAIASAAKAAARILGAIGLSPSVIRVNVAPPPPSRRAARRATAHAVRFHERCSGERAARTRRGEPPRTITHYIGTLGAGGAERQLTYLAVAQAARGARVTVLTALPTTGAAGHFTSTLAAAGVVVREVPELARQLGSLGPRRELPRWAERRWPADLRAALDSHPGRRRIVPLAEALLADPPDVFHCWLDDSNVVGGVAGHLADVPRIVISTRNVNPDHFPRFGRTWYRAGYRLLAHSPSVVAIANSRAGADDYARWCGVAASRFHVIHNGLDTAALRPLERTEREAGRAALGIPAQAFTVVGVFRLADEKRPLDFVAALAATRDRVPGLRAIHVGTGPDEDEVRRAATRAGLDDTLTFLGRRADPLRFIALADASVLTSAFEGCPNVALESQALGVPVVLTRGGGAPETVRDGISGFVCEVGDPRGIADRLVELASAPPARRASMGRDGRAFVGECFSIERMVAVTGELYCGETR